MIGSALYAGWVRKFFPRSDQRFFGTTLGATIYEFALN
jgi:hypothetical protein